MPVTEINVTRKHIRNGTRQSWDSCPIARAVRPLLNIPIGVGYSAIETEELDGDEFRMPVTAIRFIAAFDDGKPVKPFRFRLNIPAKYLKRTKRAKR